MISDQKQLCELIPQEPKASCLEHYNESEELTKQMEIWRKENQAKIEERLNEMTTKIRNDYRELLAREFYTHFRRPQEDEIPLLEISHILGIKGILESVEVDTSKPKVALDLEGVSFFHGLDWMIEAINLHRKTNPKFKLYFDTIHRAMNDIDQYQGQTINWSKHFQENQELTIIPARWRSRELLNNLINLPGHVVGIALIGNRLIYTNTGDEYDQNFNGKPGTFIFYIKNIKLITPVFIANCFKNKDSFKASDQKTFLENLNSVIDLTKETIFIPSKAQKRGNCSISSIKKNIKGILACLWSMEKYNDLTNEHILEGIKETAHSYKEFTNNTLRDNVLNKFIKLFQTNDEQSISFPKLIFILRSYIFQHYKTQDKPKNDNEKQEKPHRDISRIKKLVKALPSHFRNYCPTREEIFGTRPTLLWVSNQGTVAKDEFLVNLNNSFNVFDKISNS